MKKVMLSNGYIGIIDVVHGIDDRVVVQGIAGETHELKVYYTPKEGRPYFNLYGNRHHLDNFIRLVIW